MSEILHFALLSHCLRGNPGDVVPVWPQDVQALQANGLIGDEPVKHQPKPEGRQPTKAEAAKAAKEEAAKAEAEALALAGVAG
jgi:thiamine pyrophosphate-dependent acetolactate synthase large subunit-like protein